jgi:hypothetical protein
MEDEPHLEHAPGVDVADDARDAPQARSRGCAWLA